MGSVMCSRVLTAIKDITGKLEENEDTRIGNEKVGIIEKLQTLRLQLRSHEATYFLRLAVTFFYDRVVLIFLRGLEATLLRDHFIAELVILGCDLVVVDDGVELIRRLWL